MPKFEYKVDDEPFTTDQHELTPRTILERAKFDSKKFYLIQIEPGKEISYQGKDEEPIRMHDHMVFITAKIGPTPVSC